jgi:hypothetical protein
MLLTIDELCKQASKEFLSDNINKYNSLAKEINNKIGWNALVYKTKPLKKAKKYDN